MFEKRTDLALESREIYHARSGREPEGVDIEEYTRQGIAVSKITVQNAQGARAIGKPEGVYITATLADDWPRDPQWIARAAQVLAELLRPLLPQSGAVLVAGLGNRGITPDNLGPKAVESVIVTRHLVEAMPEEMGDMRAVCAISTGVLGLTGIETAEIIRGVAGRVRPSCIIAVDALAARSAKRLCATFQVSNTGIVPGSGAHNARHTLNEQLLGVPVIAVGVPTVIDSATLMADLLEQNGLTAEGQALEMGSLLVTPKDIDALILKSAKVIGYAINMALQGAMSVADIEQLLA